MTKNKSIRPILALELNSIKKTIFLDKNTYSLGRNSINSIVIHHRIVSRVHATLLKVSYRGMEEKHDIFWIIDGDLKGKRSTNGIFVNGKKCLSSELKPGDLILLGGVEVKAKYDLIDTNTKTLLSLSKENEDNIEQKKDSLKEEDKSTYVSEEANHQEPLTEEFIAKISSVKDLLPYPIVEIDSTGEITEINSKAQETFTDLEELKSEHPILENLNTIFEENKTNLLVRKITVDSKTFTQYAYCLDNDNVIRSYLLDVKKRQELQLTLKESDELYLNLIKQISEGIFLLDVVSKKILDANPAYCNLLGYSLEELLELTIYDIIGIDRDILQKDLQKIIKEKTPFIRESIHRGKNNSFIHVEVSVSMVIYATKQVICFAVRNITERKRGEEILRYQASHDLLTNLPNQRLFSDQLSTLLSNAKNTDEIIALIFIKLDRFKNINYTLGHNIGDKLLQSFSQRIKDCLRSGDTLARWGGDEFTILLPEIDNADNVANISQGILEKVKKQFKIDPYKINLNISMGIAIYPHDGNNALKLLKNADAALFYAQQKMGTNYKFYRPEMTLKAEENFRLENLLYLAIVKEELKLLYQPQINVKNGEITCLEVFVQWIHPELGEISSEEFLSIAQESNLIYNLNMWIIKTACKQNKTWQKDGLPLIKVAVKLYAHVLQEQDFLAEITEIFSETELDPNYLELEIKETNIVENWVLVRTTLKDLLQMGVNIALDDFGSGYSSLNYLKKFAFQKLKISESFLENLDTEQENWGIISAIITLALGFNMKIIATDIKTLEEMEMLVNLQCELMQGELFCKPLNLNEIIDLLLGAEEQYTKIIDQKLVFDLSKIRS